MLHVFIRGVFRFSDGYGSRHIKVEVGFIITPTEKNGTKLHDWGEGATQLTTSVL